MRRRAWIRVAPAKFGAAVLGVLLLAGASAWTPAHAGNEPQPARPPCPISFDSEAIPTLIEDIKAVGNNNWDAVPAASCASSVLARKGEDIIPALLSLMETRQRAVEQFALEAVCGPGHTGATAAPYIEKRLREGGLSFAVLAYPTLACIGEGAVPVIPLLLSKSLSVNLSFPTEADLATETLGALYQYDPRRILSHLVRLLDQPAHTVAAANALEKIGRPAQPSEEALRRNLAIAVDASREEAAVALTSALGTVGSARSTIEALVPLLDLYQPALTTAAARALGRFGPQASAAIPALIRRLNSPDAGSPERAEDVAALIAIDRHPPELLEALIEDIQRAEDASSNESAAAALAKVDPLPTELAPALVAAIEMRKEDSNVRRLLEQALAHTHSDLKPAAGPTPAPVDVSDRAGMALWTLTQQSRPIVLDDLVQQLHIDPNEFLYDGRPGDFTLTRKWSPPKAAAQDSLVNSVHLTGVVQSPRPLPGPPGLPAKQLLELGLVKGTCVSAEGIKARIVESGSHADIAIVQDYSHRNGALTIPVDGDHSSNRSLARASQLEAEPGCGGYVRISKSFDPEYWNYVCPFVHDRALIDTNIIPALQSKFGAQSGAYDLEAPEIRDYGPLVGLTYTEIPAEPARRSWRISLDIDRCSRTVSNVSRFIP